MRVRKGTPEDLEDIYRMYLETSLRDGFIIRPKEYYLTVWSEFMRSDKAVPLIAEVEGEMVAGMILFFFANRIWYVYGMSTGKHMEKKPNYLLQWETIKLGKKLGCELYDLWGAPDIFDKSDNMWGAYRFKVGLGCKAVQPWTLC